MVMFFFSPGSFRSDADRRVYAMAMKISPLTLISSNEYLCSLFESDIVIRVPIPNSPGSDCVTINAEVDGILGTKL